MKYTVLVHHTDGDSETSYDTAENLPYEWSTIEGAREALKCIKEHHHFRNEIDNGINYKDVCEKYKDHTWFEKKLPEYSIHCSLDDGTLKLFNAFWCGWPCHLIKAEVIEVLDEVDNPDIFIA